MTTKIVGSGPHVFGVYTVINGKLPGNTSERPRQAYITMPFPDGTVRPIASCFTLYDAYKTAQRMMVEDALRTTNLAWLHVGARRILVLVTGEVSNPAEGDHRATYFDADGPIGHVTRDTHRAVCEMIVSDYSPDDATTATESEMLALQATGSFQRGVRAVAEVQKHNARSASVTPTGPAFVIYWDKGDAVRYESENDALDALCKRYPGVMVDLNDGDRACWVVYAEKRCKVATLAEAVRS